MTAAMTARKTASHLPIRQGCCISMPSFLCVCDREVFPRAFETPSLRSPAVAGFTTASTGEGARGLGTLATSARLDSIIPDDNKCRSHGMNSRVDRGLCIRLDLPCI